MRPSFFVGFIQPELLFWPLVVLVVGWWLVMRLRKTAGVWRLRYFATPRSWLKYLHAHVPLYNRLPWELRAPFQDKVVNFVDSKFFRPGGRLDEVPESMRIIIAGNACMLLLNSNTNTDAGADVIYPNILSAQVFPLDEEEELYLKSSVVPLLWDDTNKHALDPQNRGREKELAAIGAALGVQALPQPMLLSAWARARLGEFTAEFPKALGTGTREDPSDIFAMATEVFYAAPAALRQSQPGLYDALRLFYKVDPARWPAKK